jgi:hypothetical protein
MLIHIVCWKYRSDIAADIRERHRSRLKALTAVIPEIQRFEVGADILHIERSFDTGLVAGFKDRDSLDRYTDHPEHQIVAALGKAIAERVVSVDFLSTE